MDFYTSDFHFGHKNIIKYSNRPFSDIDEMNRAIVDNMKARLKKGDRLFIIGDLAFMPVDKVLPLMLEIKATGADLYLIPGNHDSKEIVNMADYDGTLFWKAVSPLMEVNDQGRKVVLCHYSLRVWNRSHHGAYHLFGHSHGSMPGTTQSMDVGVDPCQFQPVTLDECIERMARFKPFRSEDHHKTRD